MYHITVRIKPLHNLFLVSRWAHMTLIGSAATISVTDGNDLVVSVTTRCHLVLVDRISHASSRTYNLIPLASKVWIMIDTACWRNNSLGC